MAKKEVCIKIRSPPLSLPSISHNCKMSAYYNKQFVYLPDTWFSTIAGSASMLDSSTVLLEATAAG